jgi:hypothetical protein
MVWRDISLKWVVGALPVMKGSKIGEKSVLWVLPLLIGSNGGSPMRGVFGASVNFDTTVLKRIQKREIKCPEFSGRPTTHPWKT